MLSGMKGAGPMIYLLCNEEHSVKNRPLNSPPTACTHRLYAAAQPLQTCQPFHFWRNCSTYPPFSAIPRRICEIPLFRPFNVRLLFVE